MPQRKLTSAIRAYGIISPTLGGCEEVPETLSGGVAPPTGRPLISPSLPSSWEEHNPNPFPGVKAPHSGKRGGDCPYQSPIGFSIDCPTHCQSVGQMFNL